MHCVDSGQAWQVTEEMRQQGDSTIVASRTAIDDQGRVFKKWVEADDTAVHDGQPIEGIVNPGYIDPSQAIEEFESEAFEAGVISLVGKRGIHRTIIDLSPTSREVSAKTVPKSNEPLRHPPSFLVKGGFMSDFEDEIKNIAVEMRDNADKKIAEEAAREAAAQHEREAAKLKTTREYEAALSLVERAVKLLHDNQIPTEDIWAGSVPHKMRIVGQGWHLMTLSQRGDYLGDGYYDTVSSHYSLGSTGTLQKFEGRHVYKPAETRSSPPTLIIDGIVRPKMLKREEVIRITNSGHFKKGMASLLAGLGTYKGSE